MRLSKYLPSFKLTWTIRDDDAAAKEGWGIFEVDGSDDRDGTVEIEKIDDPEDGLGHRFESDMEAAGHVYERALQGSVFHLRAILYTLQKTQAAKKKKK